jgi:glycosyltransferase involved in cell wall biosynthesis
VTHKITVAIPSHPARIYNGMLNRAINSVMAQTYRAAGISVAMDLDRDGAPRTRQRALDAVQTDWVAFLDSDDWFLHHHLALLVQGQIDSGADYIYSWFKTDPPGCDPFPITHFTNPWDDANPRQTTITVLVRTELAKAVGFWDITDEETFPDGKRIGEDWIFTLGCMDKGGKIHHVVERSWVWSHHGANTSGLPDRGDAT